MPRKQEDLIFVTSKELGVYPYSGFSATGSLLELVSMSYQPLSLKTRERIHSISQFAILGNLKVKVFAFVGEGACLNSSSE